MVISVVLVGRIFVGVFLIVEGREEYRNGKLSFKMFISSVRPNTDLFALPILDTIFGLTYYIVYPSWFV